MLGAIVGDIAGSAYEKRSWTGKTYDFALFPKEARFTDDTVMTCALAKALVKSKLDPGRVRENIINEFHKFGERYPNAGYGQKFSTWLKTKSRKPYGSFGNGSAMRVSPVGWLCDNIKDAKLFAKISSEVSHDHPDAVAAAQAVAVAVLLAREGASKDGIREFLEAQFGYNLSRTLEEAGEGYSFTSRAKNSVPEAIIAFLASNDYESAIRNAIWLGGDCDTQAAIAGAIAEAYYKGVPPELVSKTTSKLDKYLRETVEWWKTVCPENK